MSNNEKTPREVQEQALNKVEVEKELRELNGEEDKNGGFPWTVTVPISVAFCPTGKCTKSCK